MGPFFPRYSTRMDSVSEREDAASILVLKSVLCCSSSAVMSSMDIDSVVSAMEREMSRDDGDDANGWNALDVEETWNVLVLLVVKVKPDALVTARSRKAVLSIILNMVVLCCYGLTSNAINAVFNEECVYLLQILQERLGIHCSNNFNCKSILK